MKTVNRRQLWKLRGRTTAASLPRRVTETEMEEEAITDDPGWGTSSLADLLNAWQEMAPIGKPLKSAEILDWLREQARQGRTPGLATAVNRLCNWEHRQGFPSAHSLGRYLVRVKDKEVNGLVLRTSLYRDGSMLWSLNTVSPEQATRKLIRWLEKRGGCCTVRELQQANRAKYPTCEAAEASLSLLVKEGLAVWVEQGPGPQGGRPTRVLRLSRSVHGSSGVFDRFLADCCVIGRHFEVKSADLYDCYARWVESIGQAHQWSPTKLGRVMRQRGFDKLKRGTMYWVGITLAKSQPSEAASLPLDGEATDLSALAQKAPPPEVDELLCWLIDLGLELRETSEGLTVVPAGLEAAQKVVRARQEEIKDYLRETAKEAMQ